MAIKTENYAPGLRFNEGDGKWSIYARESYQALMDEFVPGIKVKTHQEVIDNINAYFKEIGAKMCSVQRLTKEDFRNATLSLDSNDSNDSNFIGFF